MLLQGLWTAMITPFLESGELDCKGLRDNIRFQLQNKVDGLVMLGTTAEAPTLTKAERDTVVAITVEEAKGKLPIMVGTGSNSTKQTIENSQRAKELGADLALVVTPYYNRPTQEGIFEHFRAVNNAVDIPLVVYNIPGRCGTNIEVQTMKKLSSLQNVTALKEASGDMQQMLDLVANTGLFFSIFSGDDLLTLPMMATGACGVISVVSNLIPGKMRLLVRAMQQQSLEEARYHHRQLYPLFKAAFLESNPSPIKEAMEFCGLPAGDVRLPLTELSEENKTILHTVLESMELAYEKV